MNILLVDDQQSVVNGLIENLNFKKIGIEKVFSALSAKQARKIMKKQQIDILLCDIEMPEENGLSLNQWVVDNYPSMVRILLTSHAEFSYAQQSIKLGCFDYIIQPAPYDEIEECLKKAALKIQQDRNINTLYDYGKLYLFNELENLDRIIYNLFSSHQSNVTEAVLYLNKVGYPLQPDSQIQLIMVDIFPFHKQDAGYLSNHSIKKNLINALRESALPESVFILITLNRYKMFVILLFANTNILSTITEDFYKDFYLKITENISDQTACYVGKISTFDVLHDEAVYIHSFVDNNVTEKAELVFCEQEASADLPLKLTYQVDRWEKMLRSGYKNIVMSEILRYIDMIAASDTANFRNLCILHQCLTQIFFRHLYESNLEIESIFSESYCYSEYMDAFKSVPALKKAVCFMAKAMDDAPKQLSAEEDDIEVAKTYIITNINRNITVKEVADHIHRSPEYFTKLFKKATGMNVKDYITRKKHEIAIDLLKNSSLPVSMVALEIGYTNFSHFTQIFKSIEGVTPTAYRQKNTDN